MVIVKKRKKWQGRMVMNFSSFDLAEQLYQKEKPQDELSQSRNDFNAFDIANQLYNKPNSESLLEQIGRDIVRTGSRMVETVFGFPGDFYQSTKMLEKKFDPEGKVQPNILQRLLEKGIYQNLPTQQSLQQQSEKLTGGFTAPQGKGEDASDEVFKLFSSLLLGRQSGSVVGKAGSRLTPLQKNLSRVGRDLGTAVAAQSAKEGVKLLGGSEGFQEVAKIGTLLLMGLTLPRLTGETSPEKFLSSIYKERDVLIPPGTMIQPTGLAHDLRNWVNKTLYYGGPTPEKKQVASVVEQFLGKLETGGAVEMEELLQMYRDINRNRASVMAVQDLDKAGVRSARRYWGEAANIFNDAIEGHLAPISQKALTLHRDANLAFHSLQNSKWISNYVMDQIRSVPLKTGVATLFGGGILVNPALAAKGLAGAATAGSAIKGLEMSMRFLSNPTLRHYYNQVIVNALRENGPETVRAIKRLDQAYERELKGKSKDTP